MSELPSAAAGEATAPPAAQEEGALQPAPRRPVRRVVGNAVPRELLENKELAAAMSVLPSNYEFEVHKTVWRLRSAKSKCVALQFPEGLLMYACTLADIFTAFAGVSECIVMGDVAYGACCVDDFSAAALGADFLVHYGHSCLVPIDVTGLPCMYVFVDIRFDAAHLLECVRATLPPSPTLALALAGTIQFSTMLHEVKAALAAEYPRAFVPQAKPLSGGEVLGCTAPALPAGTDALLFLADGRFHLEALMIANPAVPAFRYDPYARVLTRETYDHTGMRQARRRAIQAAHGAVSWGVVLGTLGRQGNPAILGRVQQLLAAHGRRATTVLLSEISPAKLAALSGVDAWVQIACPRLSIDWGEGFRAPVLTPFELEVALGEVPPFWGAGDGDGDDAAARPYPMDFYAQDSGPWGNGYHFAAARTAKAAAAERARKAAACACGEPAGGCASGELT